MTKTFRRLRAFASVVPSDLPRNPTLLPPSFFTAHRKSLHNPSRTALTVKSWQCGSALLLKSSTCNRGLGTTKLPKFDSIASVSATSLRTSDRNTAWIRNPQPSQNPRQSQSQIPSNVYSRLELEPGSQEPRPKSSVDRTSEPKIPNRRRKDIIHTRTTLSQFPCNHSPPHDPPVREAPAYKRSSDYPND